MNRWLCESVFAYVNNSPLIVDCHTNRAGDQRFLDEERSSEFGEGSIEFGGTMPGPPSPNYKADNLPRQP